MKASDMQTIENILREAFDRIQSEHKVAIDDVSYRTIDSSSSMGEKFVVSSIDFSGTAIRGGVVSGQQSGEDNV